MNSPRPNGSAGTNLSSGPSTLAVEVDGLCKTFNVNRSRPSSVRETIQGLLFGRPDTEHQIHALQNVSFTVEQGESFGVVGANGSGKSTLLKILAGTMAPDAGRARAHGRVSALIELAAGFHPEFTGRENVFLSGSLLGMRRAVMRRRFDEIVAFAELEEFIDVAVKYYSTGMYARLGFAVAISVDPDILLVDEVLAVGDGRFQRKCFKKFEELRAAGTTIVFVSHSVPMVKTVCQRALWLDKGTVRALGPARQTLDEYEAWLHRQSIGGSSDPQVGSAHPTTSLPSKADSEQPSVTIIASEQPSVTIIASEQPSVTIIAAEVLDAKGEPCGRISLGETIILRVGVRVQARVDQPALSVNVLRQDGLRCYGTIVDLAAVAGERGPEEFSVDMTIARWPLLAGSYHFMTSVGSRRAFPRWEDSRSSPVFESVPEPGPEDGIFRLPHVWTIEAGEIRSRKGDSNGAGARVCFTPDQQERPEPALATGVGVGK